MRQIEGEGISAGKRADSTRLLPAVLPYLLIILAFIADRLTKSWAAEFLAENGATRINDLLTLVQTYNRGIAFGMFQGIGQVIGWLSLFIVAGLFVTMVRTPRKMWVLRFGLALITGGSLGNLIDRLAAGQVLDFIQSPLRPGVFNVADIMINLGMILAVAGVLWQKPEPAERPNEGSLSAPEEHKQQKESGHYPGQDPERRLPINIK